MLVCVTVTVNEHVFVLPEVSVAVQVTVVTPSGNSDPDAGEQLEETRPQLSLNTGEKLTTALLWATGTLVVMFAGQVMLGATVSRTVIVKLQLVPLAEVQVTVFVPFGKNEPEAGEQFADQPGPHQRGHGTRQCFAGRLAQERNEFGVSPGVFQQRLVRWQRFWRRRGFPGRYESDHRCERQCDFHHGSGQSSRPSEFHGNGH